MCQGLERCRVKLERSARMVDCGISRQCNFRRATAFYHYSYLLKIIHAIKISLVKMIKAVSISRPIIAMHFTAKDHTTDDPVYFPHHPSRCLHERWRHPSSLFLLAIK